MSRISAAVSSISPVTILSLMQASKPHVQEQQRQRPEASEVIKLVSDNRLAREAMDWVPAVSLDEGLLRTIEFVRKNPDFYRTDGYVV